MESIDIPATVLLEAMMKKTHLPPPAYMTHATEGCQIVVRVVFCHSKQCLQNSFGPQSFSNYPSKSTELAVNNTVIQAIKYMEAVEKKVVPNFSYIEMEKTKRTNEVLQHMKER